MTFPSDPCLWADRGHVEATLNPPCFAAPGVALVDVDAVPVVAHDLVEKGLVRAPADPGPALGRLLDVAEDELLDEVDVRRVEAVVREDRVEEAVFLDDAREHGRARVLVAPVEARPRPPHEGAVVGVAQGPVAQVVAQARELDAQHVPRVDAQLRLIPREALDELAAQETHADAVREALVRRPGEDPLRRPELLQPPQPLELDSVHDSNAHRVDLDVPEHRVIEDLDLARRTSLGWHIRTLTSPRPLPLRRRRTLHASFLPPTGAAAPTLAPLSLRLALGADSENRPATDRRVRRRRLARS